MNKQEIIDGLAKATFKDVTNEQRKCISAAIDRLRSMPEPDPDFYVGWEGKTSNGYAVKIFEIFDGKLFGAVFSEGGCGTVDSWTSFDWELSGKGMPNMMSLIPNAPPKIIYEEVVAKGRGPSSGLTNAIYEAGKDGGFKVMVVK